MRNVLIIAGLSPAAFDKVRTISTTRLAPNGAVVTAPLHGRYNSHYAAALIAQANKYAATLSEDEALSVQLLYADYNDQETASFVDSFFPFSLPAAISLPVPTGNSKADREALNELTSHIVDRAVVLRQRARVMSERTNVANLTPLLLPLRNFRSNDLKAMLLTLYQSAASAPELASLLKAEETRFVARNPRTKPPTEGRSSAQHCFSDGHLFFKSPGRHRHGFFRRDAVGHDPACLLNARSRIGGTYRHSFHYDCEAVGNSLKSEYDNCHSVPTAPKDGYVNIAPNDFIR